MTNSASVNVFLFSFSSLSEKNLTAPIKISIASANVKNNIFRLIWEGWQYDVCFKSSILIIHSRLPSNEEILFIGTMALFFVVNVSISLD